MADLSQSNKVGSNKNDGADGQGHSIDTGRNSLRSKLGEE